MKLPLPISNLITFFLQRIWLFVFVLSGLLILIAPLPQSSKTPQKRLIRIEASSFQFTPGQIHINPNDEVTVELVSMDVVHGLSLDGYDFELKADPGQTATATFVADKAGVFRFRCSVACGNLHPFMIGKLQIGPNQLLIRGIALLILSIVAAFYSVRQIPQFQTRLA
jgi:heme/copper-type cytochrome/quinol oxidase subunit 2